MPSATIDIASEDEVQAGTLGRLLREFNYRRVGRYPEGQSVYINAKDEGGRLLGGFRGEIHFHWLFINVLFVEERERGKGLGARLLSEGEARAKAKGALRSRLETFEWQAPGFYLKHGYGELLKIPNYYQNYSLSTMVKDLQ
jgi:GNAT superfamily N-acetyltransferase